MRRTIAAQSARASAPAVHILSPSPDASRRFRERLAGIFGWEAVADDNDPSDGFFFDNPSQLFPSIQWDSIGLQCPKTGTLIHWVSLANSTHTEQTQPHALMGVQAATNLAEARTMLAESVQSTLSSQTFITLRSSLGQALSPTHFLGPSASPVISFGGRQGDETQQDATTASPAQKTLKEIALPFFIDDNRDDHNDDGLMEKLGRSRVRRPRPGLFQFPSPSQLTLRPLPAAFEDRTLSPASLIFHCDSVAEWEEDVASGIGDDTLRTAVVGRTGCDKGQLLVRSTDHVGAGVDIRVCENKSQSPVFAEAQESLLAASLPDLQSNRVLHGAKGKEDPKTEKMDCWTEFRANVRNPRGYFNLKGRGSQKTARAPDLPYE
eukprot:CAMPEP_0168786834 /NCGR_PEP_ID=MMETSP0725-20121227/11485_1 /TAXON_ID=265536 /ORGANISM="Amphiprora sp., Strain CCMP467" /LENGTH=378 /DNA_ID=CAMNT_0008837013 /DNA_START=35 /DNA_END=1171 /DNA_ORIENTATION=+